MSTEDRRLQRLAPALLALLTLLAYANSLGGPFLFDDHAVLVRNPGIRTVLPLALSPRWLVNLTFKLNYAVHGYVVAGYHAVNLLVHIAAGLLLYGVLRRTLAGPLHARFGRAAVPLALTCAVLWLVHPLQTESVTYICQRYEAMMGLGMLATLYAFIRAVQSDSRPAQRGWADVSIMLCVLGMGTKEVMAATPIIVWLYDVVIVRRSWRTPWRERGALHAALFLTLGILVMLELLTIGRAMDADVGVAGSAAPWCYLATQTEVILHYLRLSFVPHGLCLDYDWPVASGWGAVWPAAAVIIFLGVASAWGLCRRRAAGFIGVCFFLILVPTSSLLPVPDVAFEHRMYLPLACVIVPVVLGAYRLAVGCGVRASRLTVGAALLVAALAAGTLVRNHAYRSELAMWRDVTAKRPGNLRARNDLAIALAQSGQAAEAAEVFESVLAAIPADLHARLTRGDVPPGRFATMSSRYHYFRAHANYGRLLAASPATRSEAIRHYVRALRAAPRHPVVEDYLRDALRREGVPEARIEAEMMRRILAR